MSAASVPCRPGYRVAIWEVFGDDAVLLQTMRYGPARITAYRQHQAEAREPGRSINGASTPVGVSRPSWCCWNTSPTAVVDASRGRVGDRWNWPPGRLRGCLRRSIHPRPRHQPAGDLHRPDQTRGTECCTETDPISMLARPGQWSPVRVINSPPRPLPCLQPTVGQRCRHAVQRIVVDVDHRPILPREVREAYAATTYHRFSRGMRSTPLENRT